MEEPQEKGAVAKFRSMPGCVQVLFIVCGLIAVVSIFGKLGTDYQPRSPSASGPRYLSQDNSTMAYIMAEEWVKERLKSPSTAKFPGIMDGRKAHTKKTGPGEYAITSYVDSQNSFGGVVRTRWTARLKQTSEDGWQLVELRLE